jgi:hypothetical protein
VSIEHGAMARRADRRSVTIDFGDKRDDTACQSQKYMGGRHGYPGAFRPVIGLNVGEQPIRPRGSCDFAQDGEARPRAPSGQSARSTAALSRTVGNGTLSPPACTSVVAGAKLSGRASGQ